jgi:G3E family GTPase
MDTKSKGKHGHTHGHYGATTCQDDHVHMHPDTIRSFTLRSKTETSPLKFQT